MKITFYIALAFLNIMSLSLNANTIQPGTASLNIAVLGADTTDLSNSFMWVSKTPMFNDRYNDESYKMSRNGNIFSINAPVELEEEIVGIVFEHRDSHFGIPVTISRNTPTNLTIYVNNKLEYSGMKSDRDQHLSPEQMSQLVDYGIQFPAGEYQIPDSLYSDWHRVREYENTTLFPRLIEETFGTDIIPEWIPDWFVNNLKCDFASMHVIPYTAAAKRMNGLTVDEPPMESYSFLNEIDYSPEFLKRLPYTSLKPFLYTLLRFPEGGFSRVGDTDIEKWKEYAAGKLHPAISNPSSLLLDLLAAMSFVEQIEINGKPLSDVQIDNINRGFQDGLKDIILNKNNSLLMSLSNEDSLLDLTTISFDLNAYIEKNFPGRPVIVDTWNTWCLPCIDAINSIKAYREKVDTRNIVFLYISSESSPLQKWKATAADFGGVQLRLNEEDFRRIGEQYGLVALPSYMVFDKKHELKDVSGGKPYFSDFEKWVELVK